jgi:EAL domain-containing protein (putative c-di-GMP-specific phosphodiesterase class I)
VRFQVGFFHRAYQDHGGARRRTALLAAIRQVDTQVLIGDIRNANDLELVGELNPDYVQGRWLDERTNPAEGLRKTG